MKAVSDRFISAAIRCIDSSLSSCVKTPITHIVRNCLSADSFCCAMLCISAAYAVMRCRCVCLSGASNASRIGKKRDSGRISGFAAYRSTVLSTVGLRLAKCEKQSRDERRQASSTHRGVRRPLLAHEDDEMFVTDSTLYAGDEGRSTPLVITPVFCCRRTS